jgi:nitroreductase
VDIIQLIKKRRSVRSYLSEPVKTEDIMTILKAADFAPSAMNRKPWEFLVITGEKILQMGELFLLVVKLYEASWKPSNANNNLTWEELAEFSQTYGGAPVVIMVLIEKQTLPNFQKAFLESASAAMENMLLVATSLGLGTCWMTGPLADEKGLKILLDIPDNKEIVAVTPLGYPKKVPKERINQDQNLALSEKIRWIK